MKYLIVLLLVGCSQTQKPMLDMTNFQADCRWASYQSRELELALKQYEQSAANNYDYYQQLKNNIWALRSTCQDYKS